MMTRPIIFLYFFVCSAIFASAQNEDARLWLSFQGEKKISAKFRACAKVSVRTENYSNSWDKFLVEPSVEYRISKSFKVFANYRYSHVVNNDDHFWFPNHRFIGGFRYDYEWKRLEFRFQNKYQYGVNKDFARYDALETKNHLRDRFQILYNIKNCKVNPYVFAEVYTVLDTEHNLQYRFDTYRYQLGASYKLSEDLSVKAFLMYEHEYKNSGWWNNYVGGIDLSFDF